MQKNRLGAITVFQPCFISSFEYLKSTMLILDKQVSVIIHNEKQNTIKVNSDTVTFDVALPLHDAGGRVEMFPFYAFTQWRKKNVLGTGRKANK